MLFAVLEFSDFAIIFLIAAMFSGGAAALCFRPADRSRLQRVERKLDLILTHLGVEYTPPPKAGWQEIAADLSRKIEAIKAYREEHDVGLAEAKRAVEEHMQKRQPRRRTRRSTCPRRHMAFSGFNVSPAAAAGELYR